MSIKTKAIPLILVAIILVPVAYMLSGRTIPQYEDVHFFTCTRCEASDAHFNQEQWKLDKALLHDILSSTKQISKHESEHEYNRLGSGYDGALIGWMLTTRGRLHRIYIARDSIGNIWTPLGGTIYFAWGQEPTG